MEQPPNRSSMEDEQWRIANRNKETVLSQPHRQGNTSQRCENLIGWFVEHGYCDPEFDEVAKTYRDNLYPRWQLAMGHKTEPWVRVEFGGAGMEIHPDRIKELDDKMTECRVAISKFGQDVRKATEDLIFDNRHPGKRMTESMYSLWNLGIALGMCGASSLMITPKSLGW